jgi:hypothetical protein
MTKPSVFISYSHLDEDFKDRLVSHLSVLQHQGLLTVWEDRQIAGGDEWLVEIEQAMAAAKVAVIMVSANSLTSNFILNEEVPKLLKRRVKEGLRVMPLIIKPCTWQQVDWLARLNVRPTDGAPLSGGSDHQIDEALVTFGLEIYRLLESTTKPLTAKPIAMPAAKIELSKLPNTRIIWSRK